MFFIVNKTKQTITLGDIRVTLGPHQAIDLDKLKGGRSAAEASQHLKLANKRGDIEIRVKDEKHINKETTMIKDQSSSLDSLKKDIIGELRETLKEMKNDLKNDGGLTKDDLTRAMQSIIESTGLRDKEIIIREGNSQAREDEEVEIDDIKLVDINARTVSKIVKDTEIKSVNYKEEETENSILGNVDELSDLLSSD